MREQQKRRRDPVLMGAAFLMATTSIGPGLLTQATMYTAEHLSSMAFAIVCVILMDIVVQTNVWSVIGVSGLHGQELADRVLPGLGVVLTVLVAFGGLAFNIGNVGGVALGLNALAGIPEKTGCLLGGAFAIGVFLSKSGKRIMDRVAQVLGIVIILTILALCILVKPPLGEAAAHVLHPEAPLSLLPPMLGLLGCSCGGYVTFSGAHRLLDAGLGGTPEDVPRFRRAVLTGISVSGTVKLLLVLAVLGVCTVGAAPDPDHIAAILSAENPAAEAFYLGGGVTGRRLFGIVAAGTTCVIGAAYTSVSFLKTLHPAIAEHEQGVIVAFIAISTAIMMTVGRAKTVVVLSGTVNGMILPLSLGCILLASRRGDIVGEYCHPRWLQVLGWGIVAVTGFMAVRALPNLMTLLRA